MSIPQVSGAEGSIAAQLTGWAMLRIISKRIRAGISVPGSEPPLHSKLNELLMPPRQGLVEARQRPVDQGKTLGRSRLEYGQ